ncbi:hypothetical protein GGR56DRAFT_684746 [Xylariaceae sp. FL0804]|nr:hypothetical protein GGR56DRAFT_684746 [Xylariaceae sp. FL0804]
MASSENGVLAGFSWMDPHPISAHIIFGKDDEILCYNIHKNFLCHKSPYFRELFDRREHEMKAAPEKTGAGSNEGPSADASHSHPQDLDKYVVYMPEDINGYAFGFIQNFLYTGKLYDGKNPGYGFLIEVWLLGDKMMIEGVCDEAVQALSEHRRQVNANPSTDLFIESFIKSPEGSTLRKLLVEWGVDYVRSSESRSEFTQSLPKEVLMELLLESNQPPPPQHKHARPRPAEEDETEEEPSHRAKVAKHRHSVGAGRAPNHTEQKPAPSIKKSVARASMPAAVTPVDRPTPAPRAPKVRRSNISLLNDKAWTDERKMEFCSDLLTRMLSGPGYWTRLVGPFREPVRPVEDGVPDYLEKVTRPMALSNIREKMHAGRYATAEEFRADVLQIVANCTAYHGADTTLYGEAKKFERHFLSKYGEMHKTLARWELEGRGFVKTEEAAAKPMPPPMPMPLQPQSQQPQHTEPQIQVV